MIKRIVIGVGVAVAVLALAAVALVLLVDVNRFKPQIQQAVKERFNRTLNIDGDLGLRVFPRIAVALPKTTLSEPGGTQPFASVNSARVAVALLPLLGGRVEASKVSVDGLVATVERRADGSTNIDDLIKPRDPAAAPTPPPGQQAAPPQFEIGGVELSNANLTVRDLASKNTITLKSLDLQAGRLATVSRTPLRLTTQFTSTTPAASGRLEARGELELDLQKNVYGAQSLQASVRGSLDRQPLEATLKVGRLALAGATLRVSDVALHAQGKLGEDAFDAQLAAPDVQISDSSASGQRVSAALKLSGTQAAQVQLALEGLSGNSTDLRIAKVALNATLERRLEQDRRRRVSVDLASPATASLQAQTLALPQLNGAVAIEDPAVPGGSARMPVTAALALDAKKETLDAKLASKFDETSLDVSAGVRGFAPLQVNFKATADRLNVDRYFPPAAAQDATSGSAKSTGTGGAPADAQVDLSALKNLSLNGELNVGQLQARGLKMQNLRAALKAANGRLDVAPLTAALYGGTLNASASAQAGGNRLMSAAALTGISIQPLLKDALDKDLLEGRGNIKLDVATAGATVAAMKRALDGSGSVILRDGAFKGINIAAKLRQAQALFSRGATESAPAAATEKTDFTELAASFVIKDGVARSNDLDVKSPLLRIGGAGQFDIVAGTVDYTVRASVVNTATGQEGKELAQLRGVTVPVKLSGPLDQLSYRIEWGAVAQDALKSRAAAELKEQVSPQVDEQRKRLEERARGALKGLLGR